jgi:uncharacterized membrane protein
MQEISAITASDVHPPLYYYLLKVGMTLFGQSIFVMKTVSIIPSILTLVLLTWFLNKEFSRLTSVFFILCFLASSSLLEFSIEIRMYSWAMFFITMLAPVGWYIFKTGKNLWWALWTVCFLGAAYTHLYAALAAAIAFLLLWINIILFRKQQIVKAVVASVIAFLLYLPQISTVINQLNSASSDFWITDSTSIHAIISYIMAVFYSGSNYIAWLYFAAFLILLFLFFQKKDKTIVDWFSLNLFACVFVFMLINYCTSIIIRPLFVARYLVPLCALVLLFIAIETVVIINKKWLRALCLIAFGFMCIMNFAKREYLEQRENSDYINFYSLMEDQVSDGDIFIFALDENFFTYHVSGVTAYLYPGHTHAFTKRKNDPFRPDLFNMTIENIQKFNGNESAWIFVKENETIEQLDNVPQKENAKFLGIFGWGAYRFKLYKN